MCDKLANLGRQYSADCQEGQEQDGAHCVNSSSKVAKIAFFDIFLIAFFSHLEVLNWSGHIKQHTKLDLVIAYSTGKPAKLEIVWHRMKTLFYEKFSAIFDGR